MRCWFSLRSLGYFAAWIAICCGLGFSSATAQQEKRYALLIGNQAYDGSVGVLKNPHNDIALVAASLKKQGFEILPLVKDARRSAILGAVRELAAKLRLAGPGSVGFLYYSGHGAAEKDTNINYLIPVDAKNPGTVAFWDESLKLDDIMRLLDQARGSVKFVVFDACRNELQLPTRDTSKGLVPVAEQQGFFVAYASAPGRTASDRGERSGPYAAALASELAKRGLDHLNLFQNVKETVLASTGGAQHPWESNGLTRRVYLTGEPTTPADIALWDSVGRSEDIGALQKYLVQFPTGLFAATAKQMIARLQRESDERTKADNLRRAQDAELQKALDEARFAREALAAAERARLDAVGREEDLKRAQAESQGKTEGSAERTEADRLAAAALAARAQAAAAEAKVARDALAAAEAKQKQTEARLAALERAERVRQEEPRSWIDGSAADTPAPKGPFGGKWLITVLSKNCAVKKGAFLITIDDGSVTSQGATGGKGKVSQDGKIRWTQPALADGVSVIHDGTFTGASGSGRFRRSDGKCFGSFTASRKS